MLPPPRIHRHRYLGVLAPNSPLLARIYEVRPLLCPLCGAEMRIIAFITDGPTVRDILGHLGERAAPPRIAPPRGPPLWEFADAEHDPTTSAAPACPGLRI